jgi:hypothetical protein
MFTKIKNLFKKDLIAYPAIEAEFDIENNPVVSVERSDLYDNSTIIGVLENGEYKDLYINCGLAKHNDFITRFRAKLKLNKSQENS